jgi:hypothetical protein
MVGWRLVLKYMRTHPTHYYLVFNGSSCLNLLIRDVNTPHALKFFLHILEAERFII